MKFKIYYDKTLKLSEGKLAAQVAHITLNLGYREGHYEGYREGHYEGYTHISEFSPRDQTIIVLGLSHTKFNEKLNALRQQHCQPDYHVQVDKGLTEIPEGTITTFGLIEY